MWRVLAVFAIVRGDDVLDGLVDDTSHMLEPETPSQLSIDYMLKHATTSADKRVGADMLCAKKDARGLTPTKCRKHERGAGLRAPDRDADDFIGAADLRIKTSGMPNPFLCCLGTGDVDI